MHRKAFTLIELLIVMVIIVILAALLIPAVSSMSEKSEKEAVKSLLKKIDGAIRQFKTEKGGYPVCGGGLSGDSSAALAVPTNGLDTDLSKNPLDDLDKGFYHDASLKPYLENEIADYHLSDGTSSGSGTIIIDGYPSDKCPEGAPIMYGFWRETDDADNNGIFSKSELKSATTWAGSCIGPNPGFKREFQLWSYGPDGQHSTFGNKTGTYSADDITVTPYE